MPLDTDSQPSGAKRERTLNSGSLNGSLTQLNGSHTYSQVSRKKRGILQCKIWIEDDITEFNIENLPVFDDWWSYIISDDLSTAVPIFYQYSRNVMHELF